MPKSKSVGDTKRLDPYDTRTGATGNDEPDEDLDIEADDDTDERSSPGSGEDGGDAADLQPNDVEQGDTAR